MTRVIIEIVSDQLISVQPNGLTPTPVSTVKETHVKKEVPLFCSSSSPNMRSSLFSRPFARINCSSILNVNKLFYSFFIINLLILNVFGQYSDSSNEYSYRFERPYSQQPRPYNQYPSPQVPSFSSSSSSSLSSSSPSQSASASLSGSSFAFTDPLNPFPSSNAAQRSCYDEQGKARRCVPPFENAAYLRPVEATNTCGEKHPYITYYCVQTPNREDRNQRTCDGKCRRGDHPVNFINDFHDNATQTWWQSETMYDGIEFPKTVNITLHLGESTFNSLN